MKVNLQKIIAFITALSIIFCMFFIIPLAVSADDNSGAMSSKDYRASQSWLISQYASGKMSWSEFQKQSQSVTDRYLEENTVNNVVSPVALKTANSVSAVINKIGFTVAQFGESAWLYLQDTISDFFSDYEVLKNESKYDMKGYGAIVVHDLWSDPQTKGNPASYPAIYYCSEVIISDFSSVYYPGVWAYTGQNCSAQLMGNGTFVERIMGVPRVLNIDSDFQYYKFYGNVHYKDDDTLAPSDGLYEQTFDYDFSNATDKELEDLLNKILESLELQNPDLSTIEGLLTSIYYRLGTLDSDNDNDILNQINASILALAKNGDSDNSELIDVLVEIKEAIKEGGGTVSGDNEYLKDIAKEMKDISGTLKGLALIEVADNFLDLTESESKVLDEYADLVPMIINKIGFSVVNGVMQDLESFIFSNTSPADLTVRIYGDEYTVLSSSMFNDESIHYINIAKTFISVVLVYSWCMIMRKRIAEG